LVFYEINDPRIQSVQDLNKGLAYNKMRVVRRSYWIETVNNLLLVVFLLSEQDCISIFRSAVYLYLSHSPVNPDPENHANARSGDLVLLACALRREITHHSQPMSTKYRHACPSLTENK
jgi:hypothetical protein